MDIENLDEGELSQQIMMVEFKFWDARRNNVPKTILDEIKLEIKKLKALRIVDNDISRSFHLGNN